MSKEIVDDALNEVLDIVQRQKRAQITRANQKKLEVARRVARGKMASQKNLKKRAYAQARKIVRRKFAGKRGEEYESLGPAEKIQIDRAVEGKVKVIRKIAARLLPRIQQAEAKRLASFMKGKQLQNLGANERKNMNEETNKKFGNKFKGKKAAKVASQIKIYNRFSEEVKSESGIYKSLTKKADKAGIDIGLLGEVFDRGLAAWTEDQKVSRTQYAFARVNSYINHGKSYFNEDADLAETYKAPSFDRTPPKVGSKHKMEHRNLNKNDTHEVTHVEDGHVYFHNTRTKEIYNAPVMKFNNIRRPLKEELEEGKNTPSVKKIKGLSGNDIWKAMNKHGKTQFFNNPVSAHRHAGITHEVKEDLDEGFRSSEPKSIRPIKNHPHQAFLDAANKHMKDDSHISDHDKKHHPNPTGFEHHQSQNSKTHYAGSTVRHAGNVSMVKGEDLKDTHKRLDNDKINHVKKLAKKHGFVQDERSTHKHMYHHPETGATLRIHHHDTTHYTDRNAHYEVTTPRSSMKKPIKEELGPENEIGTDAVVRKYRKATPGQENAETHENCGTDKCCQMCPTAIKEAASVITNTADTKRVRTRTPEGKIVWRNVRASRDIIKD